MGQLVAVTEKPSTSPGVVRFELNRALTGMGHERYRSAADAFGPRPAAELARRLFATGQAAAVHVHSNIVTVDLAKGADSNGLADVVRHLYQYWLPGMAPPTFEDLQPEEEPAVAPWRRRPAVTAVVTPPWPKQPSGSRCTSSSAAAPPAIAGRPRRADAGAEPVEQLFES